MVGRFENKVAVVTGGNSGIGEATSRLFAQEGAKVALLARRETLGVEVQRSIQEAGGTALFVPCDVSSRPSIEEAVDTIIEHFGAIHILFNNAGGGMPGMFPHESDECWDAVIGSNLTGTFLMSRAVWPHLLAAGGGNIVNMSSTAAMYIVSEPLLNSVERIPPAAYSAAKAGIEALTRYMASIGAAQNIRVNCVRPGQILTRRLQVDDGQHRYKAIFNYTQLLKGAGDAFDVAHAVLFLASDAAKFITAEIMNIDGGVLKS
jgi:NAD(P)-dependent dehydrogenase (short-subunit alcohol dehydrogenase family)